MANPDSFVDEVTEELRRDRASRLLRRWGWVAVVAVVLLVGAAILLEWRNSAREARAEAIGDALASALAASGTSRPDSLAAVEVATPEQRAIRALLRGAALAESDDRAAAADVLGEAAGTQGLPERYRQLLLVKSAVVGGTGGAPRNEAILAELAVPGGPFRAIAVEAEAFAALSRGDREAAISRLRTLVDDAEAGDAMRRRAMQTLVALGAPVDAG